MVYQLFNIIIIIKYYSTHCQVWFSKIHDAQIKILYIIHDPRTQRFQLNFEKFLDARYSN